MPKLPSNPQDEYIGQTTLLSPDQAEVLEREGRSDAFGVAHLVSLAKQGTPIPRTLAYAVLSVRESRLAACSKLFGIELESATARANRFAALRAANLQIDRLEQQLGEALPADAVQLALQSMEERLRDWWRAHGLGYVSEVTFERMGARVKFSCRVCGPSSLVESITPASDRQAHAEWVATLVERGFVLASSPGDKGLLVDCEINQQLLAALVRSALPSAQFEGSRSLYFGKDTPGRGAVLREMTFLVSKLGDIAALPVRSLLED